MSSVGMPKDQMYMGFEKYKVEHAVDCLIRAEEIKTDKKMYEAASKMMGEKLMMMNAARKKMKNA